jgi:hypothetical protein
MNIFLFALPDVVEAAAQELAGIRSALDEVAQAIAAPTTGLVPAAGDEVSTAIAALFGTYGVVEALSGGLAGSVGVAFPGLFQTAESLAGGLDGALSGIARTVDTLTTALEVALSGLGLSVQAAINASLGIGVAA